MPNWETVPDGLFSSKQRVKTGRGRKFSSPSPEGSFLLGPTGLPLRAISVNLSIQKSPEVAGRQHNILRGDGSHYSTLGNGQKEKKKRRTHLGRVLPSLLELLSGPLQKLLD